MKNTRRKKRRVKAKGGKRYENVLISYESCVTVPLSQLEALVTDCSMQQIRSNQGREGTRVRSCELPEAQVRPTFRGFPGTFYKWQNHERVSYAVTRLICIKEIPGRILCCNSWVFTSSVVPHERTYSSDSNASYFCIWDDPILDRTNNKTSHGFAQSFQAIARITSRNKI